MSSSGQLPFWATAGQWGLMPEYNGGIALVQAHKPFDNSKTFQWEWGASLAMNGYNNPLDPGSTPIHPMVDELFASAKWKVFRLDVGQKRRELDFWGADRSLGSLSVTGGHVVESGNARTMPGWFGALEPIAIPFTGRHLYVYGGIGDYKTLDNRYIKNTLVHRTQVGLRGDIGDRLSLHIMLDHIAMWAGDLPEGNKMPVNMENYLRVATGRHAGSTGSKSDQINVIGNQLGGELLKAEYRGDDWRVVFQHDIPYDDGSGMGFQNFPDGVNTLSFSFADKDRWVSDIVLEHQYTLWQSGTAHDRPTTEEERAHLDPADQYHYWKHIIGGGDSYFNNGQYRSGWTHYGRTIGNPLFFPRGTKAGTWTLAVMTRGIENNRVRAAHLGISGKLFKRHPYRMMLTYSMNYGEYGNPYQGRSIFGIQYTRSEMVKAMADAGDMPLRQFSMCFNGYLSELFGVRGLQGVYGFYGDYGEVLRKAVGVSLGVRYVIGEERNR